MFLLCIIFLFLFLWINKLAKQQEENGVAEEKVYTIRLINKIFFGFIILLFVFTIYQGVKPDPNFDTFKENVIKTTELNGPIVHKCKVSRTTVKFYFNPYLWEKLSISEKVNTKQHFESNVRVIGENSGYITGNKKVNVIFYNDK